jgi:hypothetical protein
VIEFLLFLLLPVVAARLGAAEQQIAIEGIRSVLAGLWVLGIVWLLARAYEEK